MTATREPVTRPAAASAEVIPADLAAAQAGGHGRGGQRRRTLGLAQRRLARSPAAAAGAAAGTAGGGRGRTAAAPPPTRTRSTAEDQAAERDTAAVALAEAWRAWAGPAGIAGAARRDRLGGPSGRRPADPGRRGARRGGRSRPAGRPGRGGRRGGPPGAGRGRGRTRPPRPCRGSRRTRAGGRRCGPSARTWPPSGTRSRTSRPGWTPERAGRAAVALRRLRRPPERRADQAGLEGALLAAGLLSAVIQPDGTVLAADGELLISPGTARPGGPLAAALRPDPAAELPADDDRRGPGRRRLRRPRRGHGRCPPTGAGGTARCAAATSPTGPGTSARPPGPRTARSGSPRSTPSWPSWPSRPRGANGGAPNWTTPWPQLDALVRAAPRTRRPVRRPPGRGREPPTRADRSAARAAPGSCARPADFAPPGSAELSTHQATCAHLGLPAGTEALDGTADGRAAGHRTRASGLARELGRLAERARRHAEQLRRCRGRRTNGTPPSRRPTKTWSAWHAAASELAAQHDAIDLSARAGPGRAGPDQDSAGTAPSRDSGRGDGRGGTRAEARARRETLSGQAAEDVRPSDRADGGRRAPVQPGHRPARPGRGGDRRPRCPRSSTRNSRECHGPRPRRAGRGRRAAPGRLADNGLQRVPGIRP